MIELEVFLLDDGKWHTFYINPREIVGVTTPTRLSQENADVTALVWLTHGHDPLFVRNISAADLQDDVFDALKKVT